MKCKTRGLGWQSCKTRTVNFVIFVVDGVTVLKSMEGDGPAYVQYMQMITRAFKCPCLSFKGAETLLNFLFHVTCGADL